jgi:hypothetical protein
VAIFLNVAIKTNRENRVATIFLSRYTFNPLQCVQNKLAEMIFIIRCANHNNQTITFKDKVILKCQILKHIFSRLLFNILLIQKF